METKDKLVTLNTLKNVNNRIESIGKAFIENAIPYAKKTTSQYVQSDGNLTSTANCTSYFFYTDEINFNTFNKITTYSGVSGLFSQVAFYNDDVTIDSTTLISNVLFTSKSTIDVGVSNTIYNLVIPDEAKVVVVVNRNYANTAPIIECINYNIIKNEISERKSFDNLSENYRKIDERRIDILYDLSKGISYRYQNDSNEGYVKTLPSGTKGFGIKSISGKSIAWNQLADNTTFYKNDSFAGSASIKDGVITFTPAANGDYVYRKFPVEKDHVYLNIATYKTDAASTDVVFRSFGQDVTCKQTTTYKTSVQIKLESYENVSRLIGIRDNRTSGFSTITINQISSVDLTKIFGVSTVESVTNDMIRFVVNYVTDHPEYDAGSVIEATVSKVISHSKNLINWEKFKAAGGVHGTYDYDDINKSVTITATESDAWTNSSATQFGDYIKVKPNTTYTLSWDAQNGSGSDLCYLFENGLQYHMINQSCANKSVTLTTSNAARFITFRLGVYKAGKSITYSNIQLEESSSATEYVDNCDIEFEIPDDIKNLPNYGQSAEDVYNTVDYENKVYTRRISKKDLGTCTWTNRASDNEPNVWSTQISDKLYGPSISMFSYKYLNNGVAEGPSSCRTKGLYYYYLANKENSTTIYIYDSDYAQKTADQFKAALSGIYLYYEISPEVTDISSILQGQDITSPFVTNNGSVVVYNDGYISTLNTEECLISLAEAT